MTTSVTPATIIEAARILKQSSWSYEYNYPEKVSESYMHDVITALEMNINSIPEELLATAIASEIDKWGYEEEVVEKTAKELAVFIADCVAQGLVGTLPYETVTFLLC